MRSVPPALSFKADRPPHETRGGGEEGDEGFIWQTFYNDCQRLSDAIVLMDRKEGPGHLARSDFFRCRVGQSFSNALDGSARWTLLRHP